MKTDILLLLETELGSERIERNKDLFPYLTLRTNVTAQYFYEAKTREELIKAIKTAFVHKIPFFLLGGGSNIAVTKSSLEGLIIKNGYHAMELKADEKESVDLLISSGQVMGQVVNETVNHGWEGFEYHKGLPGTVGGAIYMNSKWTRPWVYVGDNLLTANILAGDGSVKQVDRDYFQFAYDWSILQKTREIFIDGLFRLKKNDPAVLQQRAKEALEYRQKTQPHGVATCGCFFRNITQEDKEKLKLPTTSAGYLIDRAGMKSASRGAFTVSDMHANFIVNKGKREGNAADLLQLISDIKAAVKEKFNVSLHEEVVII